MWPGRAASYKLHYHFMLDRGFISPFTQTEACKSRDDVSDAEFTQIYLFT